MLLPAGMRPPTEAMFRMFPPCSRIHAAQTSCDHSTSPQPSSRREPILSSRVYVWQEFRRMTPEQVLRVIPAFHPVWENTDPQTIAFADSHAGHRNLDACGGQKIPAAAPGIHRLGAGD